MHRRDVAASTAASATSASAASSPAADSSGLRVNEVSTGTTVSAADEFVELYNAGTTAIDVSGWKVVYRSAAGTSDTTLATIPAGTTIAAGGFYLLGGNATRARRPPTSRSARASPAPAAPWACAIRRRAVDSVGWGTATNALVEGSAAAAPPATAAPGSSIVRLPDGHDTNANASDFTITASATPRAANH